MKLLLDTVTFLWAVTEPARLSERAADLIRNQDHEVFLSVVSSWEVSLKYAVGRLPLPRRPEQLIPEMREIHGIATLPLVESATLHVSKLPDLHRDPFDRVLICQAIDAGLTILTPDDLVRRYPVATAW